MTTFYATKWFLLVFLDGFPFPVTVRIWDLFLFKGYDIVYWVGISILRMFESKLQNYISIYLSNNLSNYMYDRMVINATYSFYYISLFFVFADIRKNTLPSIWSNYGVL